MGSQLKQTVSETVLATTADLSTVVHTTGNESVSGVKTFANNLFVGDGSSNNVIIANNAIKQMVNGTTKTYSFPSSGGTLELQGHKHNELNAYYTTIAAVDNMDETGGQIRRENITLGMLFDNISITDPSNNNTQLLIKIGIPVTNGNFTNDSLYNVSKINLEIYDVTKSEYIIEWQSIAIDHTKDNQGRNFFLEENGFTVNPNYTFVQFDWTQYLSSAPFMLTKEQNDTYTFNESWGPLSTSKSSLSPSTWTGNSNQQIATVDLIDSKLGEYAKNNHTHHSIITPVGSAELSTDVGNYDAFRSSLYVHSPSGSNSYPPAIFIGSAHVGDYDSSYNIQIDTVTGGMSIYANHNYMTYRPITRYLIDRIERKTSANDNTYSLLFPALTADETIATVSNLNGFIPYYDASLKSVTLGSGVSTGSGSLSMVSANALGNGSIAMGTSAVSAYGSYTIAMGAGTTMTSGTMGTFAHGNSVSAIGRGCHAEGRATIAGGTVTTFAAHSEGWNTSALANYSHSEGVHVGIPSTDKFAYAWNGVSAASASGGYSSHGEGTFNINPSGGLDGFYIGDAPLSTTLATYQTTAGMSDYQPVSAMAGYVNTTSAQSISGIKKFDSIYVGSESIGVVTGNIDEAPGFAAVMDGPTSYYAQFVDASGGYVYVYSDDCGQFYYKPATGAEVTLNLPKTNGTLATQQWVSGEHLSKNTTNTQTVLSQINLSGSINVSRSHEITVGDFNAGTFASLYSDDTDAYVYAGLDAGTRYSFLTSNGLHHTEDAKATTTDLSFPAPSASGKIATNTQVNTAISTINTNFTDIYSWIGTGWVELSNVSVSSLASGFSFSTDTSTWNNKLRFFHWGRFAFILGAVKRTTALSAHTPYSGIGTIQIPAGYGFLAGHGSPTELRVLISLSAAGAFSMLPEVAIAANSAMQIRLIMPLTSVPGSYTKTTVASI